MSELAAPVAVQTTNARTLRDIARVLMRPGVLVIALFAVLALFAPLIAPYGPFEVVYGTDREVIARRRLSQLFGTTNQGMDVFSQLVWGSRVALIVGLISALGSVLLRHDRRAARGLFRPLGRRSPDAHLPTSPSAFVLPFAMVVIAIAKRSPRW
jgi:peptide/nickel transport system permease protein